MPQTHFCSADSSCRAQAKFEKKQGEFAAKKKGAVKKKAKKVLVKQEERELGWGGFDDIAPPTRTTVVLKNVFAPADFVEDPTLREDLETDMRGECAKLGALPVRCELVSASNVQPWPAWWLRLPHDS